MELSFKNDPAIKEALVKRMDAHIAADELAQGEIGTRGKGCTVWCALNDEDMDYGYSHEAFPEVLGLPEWLARLQDTIFELLNKVDAKAFSAAWIKAIPVGKNLEPVRWKFCAFLMKKNIEQVLLLDISEDLKKQVVDAITGVLSVHNNAIVTGVWDKEKAAAAREKAMRLRRAIYVRGLATAAMAAVWAAAMAAAWAAEAAVSATEEESAWAASYKLYADELLRLLSEA